MPTLPAPPTPPIPPKDPAARWLRDTPAGAACLQQALALAEAGGRRILGLTGPPGAGKSTLAEALVQALQAAHPGCAQLVPMDGFHLAQAELVRAGRADRKGAPDTFDAAGYAALLRRLRAPVAGETVYAPVFRREIEEPVAGALGVADGVALVVTEGNYLLLDDGPWAAVRPLLDACWYVDVDPALRLQRLIARHVRFGRSPEAARAWVMRSDEANARRIEATAPRADRCIRLDG